MLLSAPSFFAHCLVVFRDIFIQVHACVCHFVVLLYVGICCGDLLTKGRRRLVARVFSQVFARNGNNTQTTTVARPPPPDWSLAEVTRGGCITVCTVVYSVLYSLGYALCLLYTNMCTQYNSRDNAHRQDFFAIYAVCAWCLLWWQYIRITSRHRRRRNNDGAHQIKRSDDRLLSSCTYYTYIRREARSVQVHTRRTYIYAGKPEIISLKNYNSRARHATKYYIHLTW